MMSRRKEKQEINQSIPLDDSKKVGKCKDWLPSWWSKGCGFQTNRLLSSQRQRDQKSSCASHTLHFINTLPDTIYTKQEICASPAEATVSLFDNDADERIGLSVLQRCLLFHQLLHPRQEDQQSIYEDDSKGIGAFTARGYSGPKLLFKIPPL